MPRARRWSQESVVFVFVLEERLSFKDDLTVLNEIFEKSLDVEEHLEQHVILD